MRQDPLLDLWLTDSDIQPSLRIPCPYLLRAGIAGYHNLPHLEVVTRELWIQSPFLRSVWQAFTHVPTEPTPWPLLQSVCIPQHEGRFIYPSLTQDRMPLAGGTHHSQVVHTVGIYHSCPSPGFCGQHRSLHAHMDKEHTTSRDVSSEVNENDRWV